MNNPHDLSSAPPNGRRQASDQSVYRRHALRIAFGTTASIFMAACGNPTILKRVVVVPKIVERAIFSERPLFTTRISETFTKTSHPPGPRTSHLTTTQASPQTPRLQLRLAIGPAFDDDLTSSVETLNYAGDFFLERIESGARGQDRIFTQIAAGKLPDILVGIPGSTLAHLAAAGGLARLEPNPSLAKDFIPELLQLGVHNKDLVGIPLFGHPVYLLVNPQRLQAAGLYEPGSTYAELEESAKRMTDPTRYTYGFGVVADIPELETVSRSGGAFTDDSSVAAWQWYINQWQLNETSPPPSAWDGSGDPVTAITSGKVSMAIVHGRALRARASRPSEAQSTCDVAPMVSWPRTKAKNPVHATYVAAGAMADPLARDVTLALASAEQAPPFKGVPAWSPGLYPAAQHAALSSQLLSQDKVMWTRPLTDTTDSGIRTAVLAAAVRSTLIEGTPALTVSQDLRNASAKEHIDNWLG
jgi:ABC-type glycerol-3-phosphate transport system substrate-binding protein